MHIQFFLMYLSGNMNLQDVLSAFSVKHFFKGKVILREGQVCNYIYFIKSGLAKLLCVNGERTFIMHFCSENSFLTVMDSFTFQKPSHFQILAMEDCEVLMLRREDYERLCKGDHEIESFFRQLLQIVSSNMLRRISTMIENDASRRYEIFLSENNSVLQRISLAEMADYIGITQVSLSRIRAKK